MKTYLYAKTNSSQAGVSNPSVFSPWAILAGIGVKLRELQVFDPVAEQVKIAQKTVKFTPIQKLWDGFINFSRDNLSRDNLSRDTMSNHQDTKTQR